MKQKHTTRTQLIRLAWKTERKEFILNMLSTTVLAAFGIFVCYLHFIKWIPFENFDTSLFALGVDFLWAYTGCFIGITLFTIAAFQNFVTNLFLNWLFEKFLEQE